MQADLSHCTVLLNEAVDALSVQPDGHYIDATFGRGGHSQGILNLLGQNGRLVSLDRDAEAFNSERAQSMLLDQRFALKQSCFSQYFLPKASIFLFTASKDFIASSSIFAPSVCWYCMI